MATSSPATAAYALNADDAPADDERECWLRWRNQADPAAHAWLLQRHLPYARTVAAIYYARRGDANASFDDYYQSAALALIESMQRYHPDGGAQFKTFAAHRMHGAILNTLDHHSEKNCQLAVLRRLRNERVACLDDQVARPMDTDALFHRLADIGIGLALGMLLEGTGMIQETPPVVAEHPYFQSDQFRQLRGQLTLALRHLNAQQSQIIRGHYFQQLRFDEIAVNLKLSKGRVSQLHYEALQKLRHQLGPQALRELLT